MHMCICACTGFFCFCNMSQQGLYEMQVDVGKSSHCCEVKAKY